MLAFQWLEPYTHTPARFLPWALVIFFLAVALRIDQRLPQPAILRKLLFSAKQRSQGMPRLVAGGWMGTLTPLLPCAPLYAVFALALMTQSPVRGAQFLLAFGMGTVPLLLLTQTSLHRLQGRLRPHHIQVAQRVLALLVAAILGYRLFVFETGADGFFCH